MKVLAAYLLLVQGGNSSPSASDITSLLSTVGIEAEDSRIESLLSEVSGKSIDDLISEGSTKLGSVLSGGGGASSSGGAAASGGAAPAAAEEKPAEKEEEAEVSDEDMGFGLFD